MAKVRAKSMCHVLSCQISTKADLFYRQLCNGISEANKVYEIIIEEKKEKTHTFNMLQIFASMFTVLLVLRFP